MEGPVNHRPTGKGQGRLARSPCAQGAHIFMKTATALLPATLSGSQRTAITSCSPQVSVPAATVTHTVTSRSRHAFILLLCDTVCFSASAKDQSVLQGLDYGPARSLETQPVLVTQTTWPAVNPQLSPRSLCAERCTEGNRPRGSPCPLPSQITVFTHFQFLRTQELGLGETRRREVKREGMEWSIYGGQAGPPTVPTGTTSLLPLGETTVSGAALETSRRAPCCFLPSQGGFAKSPQWPGQQECTQVRLLTQSHIHVHRWSNHSLET